MEPFADRVRAGVKKSLPGSSGIVPDAVTAAAILGRTVIHIAEPRRAFEPHAAQPRVLRLRKWVDSEKDIEILLVGKAAEAVIAPSAIFAIES